MRDLGEPYEATREDGLNYTFTNKDGIQFRIIFEPIPPDEDDEEELSDTPLYHYRMQRVTDIDGPKIADDRILATIKVLIDRAWKDAEGKISSMISYHTFDGDEPFDPIAEAAYFNYINRKYGKNK
jgi:hypothetical protein